MAKLAELIETHGRDVFDWLDRDIDIPVLDGPQAQGDVFILPVTTKPATTPIPARGVIVATGQGGHDHVLLAGGFFDRTARGGLVVGTLTVPAGAEQYLAHDEHGYTGIAPGTYTVNTQREYAGQWRQVAD